jgi:hypothetical protein
MLSEAFMLDNHVHGQHYQGVDQNIPPKTFVRAMIAASGGRGPEARHIKDEAELMQTHQWTITAGLHQGGLGGGGYQADPRPHITLNIFNVTPQRHVHYKLTPSFLITDISP